MDGFTILGMLFLLLSSDFDWAKCLALAVTVVLSFMQLTPEPIVLLLCRHHHVLNILLPWLQWMQAWI